MNPIRNTYYYDSQAAFPIPKPVWSNLFSIETKMVDEKKNEFYTDITHRIVHAKIGQKITWIIYMKYSVPKPLPKDVDERFVKEFKIDCGWSWLQFTVSQKRHMMNHAGKLYKVYYVDDVIPIKITLTKTEEAMKHLSGEYPESKWTGNYPPHEDFVIMELRNTPPRNAKTHSGSWDYRKT